MQRSRSFIKSRSAHREQDDQREKSEAALPEREEEERRLSRDEVRLSRDEARLREPESMRATSSEDFDGATSCKSLYCSVDNHRQLARGAEGERPWTRGGEQGLSMRRSVKNLEIIAESPAASVLRADLEPAGLHSDRQPAIECHQRVAGHQASGPTDQEQQLRTRQTRLQQREALEDQAGRMGAAGERHWCQAHQLDREEPAPTGRQCQPAGHRPQCVHQHAGHPQLRAHKPSCVFFASNGLNNSSNQHQHHTSMAGGRHLAGPIPRGAEARPEARGCSASRLGKHGEELLGAGLREHGGEQEWSAPFSGSIEGGSSVGGRLEQAPAARHSPAVALVASTLLKREISKQLNDWHRGRRRAAYEQQLNRGQLAGKQTLGQQTMNETRQQWPKKTTLLGSGAGQTSNSLGNSLGKNMTTCKKKGEKNNYNSSKFISQLYFLIHLSAIISLLLHHKNLLSTERKTYALQSKAKRSTNGTTGNHSPLQAYGE